MKRCVVAAVFALLFFACPLALEQASDNEIVIEVNDSAAPISGDSSSLQSAAYLSGYGRSLGGQTIEYHSSDPDVDSALLVRGQTIAPSISWETDSVPDTAGEYLQFIWLAGIECAGFEQEKESHHFAFLIDGEPWFTFENAKDESARHWKVSGKDGAELSFSAIMTDKAGDLFGHMTLKVPAKQFAAGKPLRLEVRGDNSGSPDWYMTFQHPFTLSPQVRSEPALVRDGERIMGVLRIHFDNLVGGRSVTLRAPNQKPIKAALRIGANISQLPIPAATSARNAPIVFKLNGKIIENSTVRVLPVHKLEIYLLSYSHNDIGYTDLQPDVERKQWNNLDEAMRLIRETRNYPTAARYKWNLETIWALESWLKHASSAQREEFFADVREGSVGLSALYANMLTGLANSDEMSHFFDFARRLRGEDRIPMTTAVTSDVPGFSWGLVSALAQSGVRYFATAPNSGDRIGYTLKAWGDKPLYWTSQSGRQKVLTWMAGASYSSFHQGTLAQFGDEKILKLARKLDEESYPYDMVQLPYTLADNGPPDPTLSDFVRKWNERYVTPRLIIATHDHMFQEFEKRYGTTLPVAKGDFTPYWEDGAASTAFETALNRATVDRLIQGETLWSMLAPRSFPYKEYAGAWRNAIMYDEHTWGAHNSIEEPDSPFVKRQWEIKRQFALEADRLSRALLQKALHSHKTATSASVDVFNTNSWSRTDLVVLSSDVSKAGDLVVDPDGRPVPSQRLSTGELALLARNVPPFASRRFIVRKGEAYGGSFTPIRGTTIENDSIALTVDSNSGAITSLKWTSNGAEFVDSSPGLGLGQYLYVPGTDSSNAQTLSHVHVRVKEEGSLVTSLLAEADAPGAKHYSAEVRLIAGLNRLDLMTNIDKLPIRTKEGVHLAFPFAVPSGQLRSDVADSIVRPEADQLAGACKNFFSVQSWVDVSNRDYGLTWSTANAPLIEIGAITAERPWMKTIEPSSSFYSYVMNNYWHTNYKADQEGPVTFSYSLLPHGAFSPVEVTKFGIERRQPLLVTIADSSIAPGNSFFQISSSGVLVLSVKPIAERSFLLHLYNPTGEMQVVGFRPQNASASIRVRLSDAAGMSGKEVSNPQIAAFDSAYLRLEH
jgi:alpha-mannosidase